MNDTLELIRAQVKVRYVNDPKPGKKMGTIKTYEDEYFYVRNDMLRIFRADETYDLGYTETQGNNGLPLRTVQKATSVKDEAENYPSRQAARREAESTPHEPQRQPQNGNGGGYYRPTSPEDKKSMFRCACVTAAIKSRQVPLDRQNIAALIVEIDAGYDMAMRQELAAA